MKYGVGKMEIDECYEILELPPGSDLDAIKSAYRDLTQVWHPDRFGHSRRLQIRANDKLKSINEAYQYLCKHLAKTKNAPSDKSRSLVYQKNIQAVETKIIEIANDPENYKYREWKELLIQISDYKGVITSGFYDQKYGYTSKIDGSRMSISIRFQFDNKPEYQVFTDVFQSLEWRVFPPHDYPEWVQIIMFDKNWDFAKSSSDVRKVSEEIINTFITVLDVSPDEHVNFRIITGYWDEVDW